MSSAATVCLCMCRCVCACSYSMRLPSIWVYLGSYGRARPRARRHLPFSVLHRSVFVSRYLFHLSWHANPSVCRCEMWVVASDCEIWAAVIFRFGIPLSLCGINLRWKRSCPQTIDKSTVMYDTRALRAHAMLRPDLSQIYRSIPHLINPRAVFACTALWGCCLFYCVMCTITRLDYTTIKAQQRSVQSVLLRFQWEKKSG